MRHRHIVKKKKESICDLIRGAHDAWSGWVCVLLVSVFKKLLTKKVTMSEKTAESVRI